VSKSSPEPDGRAPFEPIDKDPEKAGGVELGALLDEKYGGGVVKLDGGVELAKLLGGWCVNGIPLADAAPAELERITAAIKAKE
jgi:hypothetical protein